MPDPIAGSFGFIRCYFKFKGVYPLEDKEWFTQQILACEPSMYRLAISIVGNTEDASDAAQEAILIAYQKLHTLRQRESFRPWLMKILTNECYAVLRRRQPQVPLEELSDHAPPSDQEEHQQLWQAVCDLNQSLRSVVILYYYEGFSGKEIGTILGITQDNVKTRLSRARKHLKTILEAST